MGEQSLLRKVQLFELDMLKKIAEICDRHGLRYYLYCGTLLGCIRHEGFIPWDDDIDIAMPLKDYRAFIKVAQKELGSEYFVQNRKTDPEFHLLWTKISAVGTTYMIKRNVKQNIHWGISIDIYPFIGVPEGKFERRFQTYALQMAKNMFVVDRNKALGIHVKTVKGIILYNIPCKLRSLIGGILLRIAFKNPEQCELAGTIDLSEFAGKYRWKDWKLCEKRSFEGIPFVIPSNYDKFLREMYGDYMVLPPIEKRMGHLGNQKEGEIIIDLHRDSSDFRKIILEKEKRIHA